MINNLLKFKITGVLPRMFIFLILFTQQAFAVEFNENGKQGLDLDSFPSLYGPNSKLNVKTIAGLLNISDMSCAIKPNPQKPLIDTAPIELGDIATCKLNEAGLRDFVNAGAMQTFRQSVSRNSSLYTDLIFDCAEYKAVSAIFSARHASVPLSENNLNSVMNNATKDCRTAHHTVSKDHPKTPKSYPDPYKENSDFLVNWTTNPNYPDNLLKEISSHLREFIDDIDSFYLPYNTSDVLGVYLGQSLTDLSNLYAFLSEDLDINNPSLHTTAYKNFNVDYLQRFLKVTGIRLTREFDGIADLKELSERLINKYKGLGLEPPKFKVDSARIESKSKKHNAGFCLNHNKKPTGGTTTIMYSIESNISPTQLYPHVLPIVRDMQIWALDKYRPETVDGSNIAL